MNEELMKETNKGNIDIIHKEATMTTFTRRQLMNETMSSFHHITMMKKQVLVLMRYLQEKEDNLFTLRPMSHANDH